MKWCGYCKLCDMQYEGRSESGFVEHMCFVILCYDQQMDNYFTNYHISSCFDIYMYMYVYICMYIYIYIYCVCVCVCVCVCTM